MVEFYVGDFAVPVVEVFVGCEFGWGGFLVYLCDRLIILWLGQGVFLVLGWR